MFSTDTWLKIICGMQINAILFGIGAVAVLTSPVLAENAKFWLAVVVVASFSFAPLLAMWIAPRMRLRYWREIGRRGDAISG